jgi:hypothetical protein
MLELYADRCDIYAQMQLPRKASTLILNIEGGTDREHREKEGLEVIEHLGEEIPPQPDVRRQVSQKEPRSTISKCSRRCVRGWLTRIATSA